MRLQELSRYLDINIAAGLEERFMGSEELYVRFLRKLAASQELAQLQAAVAAEDWQEALRLAHNLKGVCATLELYRLAATFEAVVMLLRGEVFAPKDVKALLLAVEYEWDKTVKYINKLQESD